MLSKDAPLTDPSKDLLGHAPFAKAMAASLSAVTPAGGLVVALHGPWGSGKTTILRFVKYYLTQQLTEAERPIVVDFSPWWFSGQQDLTQRFLDQLAGHLKNEHVSNDTLLAIGDFTDAIADFPVNIPWVSNLLKTGAKILKALREARQKDLTGLKERVEAELLKLGRHIVVILDDIDRLTAEEVRQIFGLIKSVANFPNIIYLMAFDRAVVTKALEPLQHLPKGKEYLEKIVQISLEVPPPEDYMLAQLVGAAVDTLSNETPAGLIDQHDLLNMFAIVSRFLKTPRDCARFNNGLLTTYLPVKGEVNFADFIGMEALRVFAPTVYELVVANPERFAGTSSGLGPDKELATFHQDWIKSVPQDQQVVIRDITTRLFPKVGAYWGRPSPTSSLLEIWRKECRAASPEILPTFLRLPVPTRSLSRQAVMRILDTCTRPDVFEGHLRELMKQKLPDGRSALAPFLERAKDLLDRVNPPGLPDLLGVLINDDIIAQQDRWTLAGFPVDNLLRIDWLIFGVLRSISPEQRGAFVKYAITNGKGLSGVIHLVSQLEEEHDPKRVHATTETVLRKQDVEDLKGIALERVRSAAKTSTIKETPLLARVLWVWKRWGRPGEAEEWVSTFIADDDGFLKMLAISTTEVRESSERNPVPRRSFRLNVEAISQFVDLSAHKGRLDTLKRRPDLNEEQRAAIDQAIESTAGDSG